MAKTGTTIIKTAALAIIHFYQRWISAALPPHCRFVPSCSCYAAEAIETHGSVRGMWLAITRVCRCHPFHPGGYDPVPLVAPEKVTTVQPPGVSCLKHTESNPS